VEDTAGVVDPRVLVSQGWVAEEVDGVGAVAERNAGVE
jgi:hypothetical protein